MRRLNDDIAVFGLFGYPVGHSLSPAMHNAALRALKIPGIYFAFERRPKDFLRLIQSRRRMILDGFNLTVPFKEVILPSLDRVDRDARLAGAVNTVKRIGNRWMGYNTDIGGFLAGLRQVKCHSQGRKIVILGAGGAARAVAVALGKSKAREVVIVNRTFSRAKKLVDGLGRNFPKMRVRAAYLDRTLKENLKDCDLLVNTTSIGLKKSDPLLVPANYFPKKKILVYDLIYSPARTRLLKLARKLGHRIQNGECMLLHQGAQAFEIWTGRKAPLSVMKKALSDALGVA